MARQREFEIDAVLESAMKVFWRKGYFATTVADLVDATGLHRGSLYAAFGSKAEIYHRALERYMSAVRLRRAVESQPGRPVRDVLREVLQDMVETAIADRERRGCLMTNTAIELAGHDPAAADAVAETFADLERVLAARLDRAQAEGEVSPAQSPEALARFVVGTIQGLRVMAKLRPERGALEDIVSVALGCLAPPA